MPNIRNLKIDKDITGNEKLAGTDTNTGVSSNYPISAIKNYIDREANTAAINDLTDLVVKGTLTIDTDKLIRFGQVTMSNGTDEQTFTVSGITASSIVTATISFNDNGRYIKRVQPGTNSLTVKLQGAADTAIISYIAIG